MNVKFEIVKCNRKICNIFFNIHGLAKLNTLFYIVYDLPTCMYKYTFQRRNTESRYTHAFIHTYIYTSKIIIK